MLSLSHVVRGAAVRPMQPGPVAPPSAAPEKGSDTVGEVGSSGERGEAGGAGGGMRGRTEPSGEPLDRDARRGRVRGLRGGRRVRPQDGRAARELVHAAGNLDEPAETYLA